MEQVTGDFLIYGGLTIPCDGAHHLSDALERLRSDAKIKPDTKVKFAPPPGEMSNADYILLKQAIINEAIGAGAKLLAYAVLHGIAHNPDEARRYGINTVCYHFDCLLNRTNEHGLVLIDQFTDKDNAINGHLREKFSVGVKGMPHSPEIRLSNIIGFHYSAVGQSHFPSLIDIVLGSLRHAINIHTRGKGNTETAKNMLAMLEPLFFREPAAAPVSELSFAFSPRTIRSPIYRAKYQSLKDFLDAAGINTAQPILADG